MQSVRMLSCALVHDNDDYIGIFRGLRLITFSAVQADMELGSTLRPFHLIWLRLSEGVFIMDFVKDYDEVFNLVPDNITC